MTTQRLYKPRISVLWWLSRRSYTLFVLRELSSLFVGWAVVYLLLLIRDEEQPVEEGEYLQTPAELDEYKQFSMCINCMLCYSACPVYGLDSKFVGPAAIALAQRYNLDSRDEGADRRLTVLSQPEGVWGCTFVGECSRACPKGVDPAGAIQRYKLTAAMESLKSFLLPRGSR